MPRLFVGLPALVGDPQKYAKRFDVVELRPVDTSTPRTSTLRAWRKAVAPSFVFSVVLPRAVGELVRGASADEALAKALDVSRAVEARCLVLTTPPSVRPTAANRSRIASLLATIPREGVIVAWEPLGMWERDDIIGTAKNLDVVPVFDAAREALGPGPVAYSRVRALGKGTAMGSVVLDRIAERVRNRRDAFIIADGSGAAMKIKSGVGAALADQRGPARGGTVIRPSTVGRLVAEDEEQ